MGCPVSDAVSTQLETKWDRDAVRRSLDELFTIARRYRSCEAYNDLLKFIVNFGSIPL